MNSPTRICVFNINPNQVVAAPIVPNQTGSNLIDIVTAVDGVTVLSLGAASAGVPVVLNPSGVIDPSLIGAAFDFADISGCLVTTQLCSVQGTGAYVQLTAGALPPSPVTTQLGSAANYAVLASAGITNTGSTSISGGVIGSSPTPSITGFNPPPATVDNTDAGAAQTDAVAAYTHYSTLPAGTIISSVASQVFTPGTYTASSTLLFSGGTVTLNGAGVYIFQVGSALNVTTGPTIFVLTNGATAAAVIFVVGSAATFDANQATGSFVGTIIAQAGISFVGGILNGRAISTGASVTFAAAETITVPSGGGITAGDIVTFDAFGNTQDSGVAIGSLPHTFTPVDAGSPPEYEFLIGYDATTGLFTAAPAPTAGAGIPGGQVTLLSGNTTVVYSFVNNYTGAGQPILVVTPTSNLGATNPIWITYQGATNAWTGFTVNVGTAPLANVIFNYVVIGQV